MKPRFSRFDCNPGCSVEATLSLIDGKWKGVILFRLLSGPVRFNAMRRLIPAITQRMLTNQLRELEADGLVTRTVHEAVPPRVDYALSDLGRSLEPVLVALRAWGERNQRLFASAVEGTPGSDAETLPAATLGAG